MIELKPCPFCGSAARFASPGSFEYTDTSGIACPGVFCNHCGAGLTNVVTDPDYKRLSMDARRAAIAKQWNRRAEV